MHIGCYGSNMQAYIPRTLTEDLGRKLRTMPVVAVLGPRQCGKSTLAQAIISQTASATYLDLERASDLNKLQDPEAFFQLNADRLICLDEIQRQPALFPQIRAAVDAQKRNGQFLLLGSASPELLRQSSETLAGRIAYLELTPFLLREVSPEGSLDALRSLWLRGGFARSYLAPDELESFEWRLDFIRTFLERDIPQLGFHFDARRMARFWKMCAHVQGQLLNSSKIGESLGVSHHTVRSYLELLERTFLVRVLPPLEANLKKRLVKSPKVFIRDTGLLHALLDIESHNDLLGHPAYGVSWESFVLENIITALPRWRPSFFRAASGAELDLVLEKGNRRIAVECKASTSPEVGRGFWSALETLAIEEAWIIAPVQEAYPYKRGIMVASLPEFLRACMEPPADNEVKTVSLEKGGKRG